MLQATAQGPQLRDIHLPPPPSWWPPAPGWWLLAALIVALFIFIFVFLYKKLQYRRRRRALLTEFDRTVAASRGDTAALAAAVSAFLRRIAMRSAPHSAALAGEAWLSHLDNQFGGDEFSAGIGRALVDAPFRANADYDVPAVIALARRSVVAACARGAAHV